MKYEYDEVIKKNAEKQIQEIKQNIKDSYKYILLLLYIIIFGIKYKSLVSKLTSMITDHLVIGGYYTSLFGNTIITIIVYVTPVAIIYYINKFIYLHIIAFGRKKIYMIYILAFNCITFLLVLVLSYILK